MTRLSNGITTYHTTNGNIECVTFNGVGIWHYYQRGGYVRIFHY